jgi:hypothetical protein|tara:strand:- start:141 stop:602 length:462 start_codon:yes stop_codon:yes gene_type:complete
MVDNQNSTLDLDVIKFRAEILTKYGKELTIFHKEGNGWNSRPTLGIIHEACISVMHDVYPHLRGYKTLGVANREKHYVMFRKIYMSIASEAHYTRVMVGASVNRDHSSVSYSLKSLKDMLYIGDIMYTTAHDLTIKTLNNKCGNYFRQYLKTI